MAFRLAPTVTPDTRFFWDAVRDGKLLAQRCGECGTVRHPPGPMCPQCNSLSWDTIESSGRGELISFVMPHHPPSPGMDDGYIVALVQLEPGFRFVSNLIDVAPDAAEIGMAVEVCFETFDGDVVLPMFRPVVNP